MGGQERGGAVAYKERGVEERGSDNGRFLHPWTASLFVSWLGWLLLAAVVEVLIRVTGVRWTVERVRRSRPW